MPHCKVQNVSKTDRFVINDQGAMIGIKIGEEKEVSLRDGDIEYLSNLKDPPLKLTPMGGGVEVDERPYQGPARSNEAKPELRLKSK